MEILEIEGTTEDIRSFTDLSIKFYLPLTEGGVMNSGDFLSMTLSTEWGLELLIA